MFSLIDSIHKIRKHITRVDLLVFILLFIFFFATRLINILALPIFSDEGIYINWARIAANDPAWRFISLTDGKQPLQTWGTLLLIKQFPNDLLLAGRLFSVITGFAAMVGIIALCWYLWGKKAGYIAGILYIVCPYFLFYDRMALVDSGVNAAVIWILFLSIALAKSMRLDVAIAFGFVTGIGLLAKSSLFMFLGLSAFAIIFIINKSNYQLKLASLIVSLRKDSKIIIDFGALFVLSTIVAVSMYMLQRFFSPFFHYIAAKNLTFIVSPKEWLADPFGLIINNIKIVPLYVIWESGWLPIITGIIGLGLLWKYNRTLAVYLIIWILLPFIVIVNFNKVIFPRYLIFFPTLFIIPSVYTLIKIKRLFIPAILFVVLVLSCISYPILFDVKAISLPPVDRGQYIEGVTAVWGAEDLVNTIRKSTTDGKPALVVAEGNFGLIADVLQTYILPNDKIEIQGQWPLNEEHILKAKEQINKKHIFVVFSHKNNFPVYWQEELMKLIKKYDKPNNSQDAVFLFEVRQNK